MDNFFRVLEIMLSTYMLYFGIIAIGVFLKNKKIQKSDVKRRFAILVPARNEERVIRNLLISLKNQNYDKRKYDIFVLPNNCTDETEKICNIEEVNIMKFEEKITSKGDVLKLAFSKINDEFKNYDSFLIFDSDNVVHPDFISKMNDAYNSGYKVAQGYRDSKNPSDTWISNTHSLYYWLQNFFFNKARMNLGKSCFLNGTGMMISREFIEENGYNVFTITEDIELTVQCAIKNVKILFVEDAITYDEQPLKFGDSYKQRKRWSKGMLECLKIYNKDISKRVLKKFEILDAGILIISPIMQIVGTLFYIVYGILGIMEKLNINYSSKLIYIVVSYLAMIVVSSIITKFAKKEIRKNIKGILLLPVFIFSWIPINFEAVLKKQVKWESIEHSRIISIENAMEKREITALSEVSNKKLLKIS